MSSSKDEDLWPIKLMKRDPGLTPPGLNIKLSTAQAVLIAEFVDSPVFKILRNVYVAQRKDHLARANLSNSLTSDQLHYYKGSAAELVAFFKNLEKIKKVLVEDEAEN